MTLIQISLCSLHLYKKMSRETSDPVYGANSVYSPEGSDFNVSVSEVTTTAVKQQSIGQRPCVVCQRSHGLFSCEDFKSKDARARFNIAKQHRLCFNCLVPGHYADKCRKPSVCSVPGCGRKHTKFLHTDALSDKWTHPGQVKWQTVVCSLVQCQVMYIYRLFLWR